MQFYYFDSIIHWQTIIINTSDILSYYFPTTIAGGRMNYQHPIFQRVAMTNTLLSGFTLTHSLKHSLLSILTHLQVYLLTFN